MNKISSIAGGEALITRAETGIDESDIKVYVADTWHYQPYQIRLQAAQNLWKLWASIRSPRHLDWALISLVDSNGNSVGGSSVMAGFLVSVNQ